MSQPQGADRTGLLLGAAAYGIWGALPMYLHLLQSVPALQVLSHRILWSLILLAGMVIGLRRGRSIAAAAARGRTLLLLVGSATLIAINWLVYIWAVQHGHVLDASLGYFINPLLTVALAVMILGERLRRWQGIAIALAALGVLPLALQGGGSLWIPIALALSFGGYGLLRKVAGIDALGGLTVETLLLAPLALIVVLWTAQNGTSAFGGSTRIDLLLIAAGAVTATPLLLFAAAAKRLPYATVGLLQYITPTLQFLEAVLLFGEPVLPVHLATFALIWSGCALYAWDSVRAYRAAVKA